MARIHCSTLFNDLVFVGLDAQQNLVGFHRTNRLSSFLGELERQAGPTPSVTEVETFMRDFRPDFLRYLRVPSRAQADDEYLLLGHGGLERGLDLKASVCGVCYASQLTGGLPIHVSGLKYDSDVQELYVRLGEMLPQTKAGELTLRLMFHDREKALAEVIVSGTWNGEDGRYEWTCTPSTAAGVTGVDSHMFDPAERLCQPQLADLGMFLPAVEIIMCTRGCPHSTIGGAAGATAAAATHGGVKPGPMAHDLFPHSRFATSSSAASSLDMATLGTTTSSSSLSTGSSLTPSLSSFSHSQGGDGDGGAAAGGSTVGTKRSAASIKRGAGNSKSKRGSAAAAPTAVAATAAATGVGIDAFAGVDLAPLPPMTTGSTRQPSSSSGSGSGSSSTFPFLEIEPGPVHFAGGGGREEWEEQADQALYLLCSWVCAICHVQASGRTSLEGQYGVCPACM